MNIEEARQCLRYAGFVVLEEKRLGNNTGTQLRLNNGAIVNIYDKGTYHVQGKNTDGVETALSMMNPLDFNRLKGEYLNLDASIEYQMSMLISEWLQPESHGQTFEQWITQANIPFSSKVDLLENLVKPSVDSFTDLGTLASRIREVHKFRNTVAHCFPDFMGYRSSKGHDIPMEKVSIERLRGMTEEALDINNLLLNIWGDIASPPPFDYMLDVIDGPR